jgi:hypothetical protein
MKESREEWDEIEAKLAESSYSWNRYATAQPRVEFDSRATLSPYA